MFSAGYLWLAICAGLLLQAQAHPLSAVSSVEDTPEEIKVESEELPHSSLQSTKGEVDGESLPDEPIDQTEESPNLDEESMFSSSEQETADKSSTEKANSNLDSQDHGEVNSNTEETEHEPYIDAEAVADEFSSEPLEEEQLDAVDDELKAGRQHTNWLWVNKIHALEKNQLSGTEGQQYPAYRFRRDMTGLPLAQDSAEVNELLDTILSEYLEEAAQDGDSDTYQSKRFSENPNAIEEAINEEIKEEYEKELEQDVEEALEKSLLQELRKEVVEQEREALEREVEQELEEEIEKELEEELEEEIEEQIEGELQKEMLEQAEEQRLHKASVRRALSRMSMERSSSDISPDLVRRLAQEASYEQLDDLAQRLRSK